MPRNGANVYAKPVGTTPIDGDDIDAAPFNLLMDDIATDLNTPRPVVAGGTGASNAPAALVSLGALSAASGLSDLLAPSKGLANLYGYATTVKSGGTTTLTAASAVYQRFTGVAAQSVVLPDAGTLQLGSFFELHNNDTSGSLTVKSADGSTVMTALAGQIVRLVCVLASGSTAASWKFAVCGFPGVTGSGNAVLNTDPIMARPVLFNPQVQTQATIVAGTDAQGQGLITGDLVVVITTAAAPSGVTLPAATDGRWITVVNRGTNPINVYPASGAAIDAGAANAPVQIAVGAGATFSAKTTTAWESSVQLSGVAFDARSLLNLSSAFSGAAGAPRLLIGALQRLTPGSQVRVRNDNPPGATSGSGLALGFLQVGTVRVVFEYRRSATIALFKRFRPGAADLVIFSGSVPAGVQTYDVSVLPGDSLALSWTGANTDYGLLNCRVMTNGEDYFPIDVAAGTLEGNTYNA